ncbi:MAG: hypothetical protein QOD33_1310 [Pyrinomonadaceae bacterium]|nr:hypothetical protein [Pyrinomonadaceae bacterium]
MNIHSPELAPADPALTLRPVVPADEAFLLDVYTSTRAAEMVLVPWTVEQQQAFIAMQFASQQEQYRRKYPAASHHIILDRDRLVGTLYVARMELEIRIVDLTLLPAERNRGIGTFLLKRLQEEAACAGKLLKIFVEDFNPSLRLFERLGFASVEQEGIHLLLEWSRSAV